MEKEFQQQCTGKQESDRRTVKVGKTQNTGELNLSLSTTLIQASFQAQRLKATARVQWARCHAHSGMRRKDRNVQQYQSHCVLRFSYFDRATIRRLGRNKITKPGAHLFVEPCMLRPSPISGKKWSLTFRQLCQLRDRLSVGNGQSVARTGPLLT